MYVDGGTRPRRHILEQERDHGPKGEPDDSHDPPWARVPVEDGVAESDLVQKTADERADGEASALADDEPSGQGRPAAHADDARVGAVAFGVQELRKGYAHHDPADEDQVEKVGPVGQRVEDAPD